MAEDYVTWQIIIHTSW